MEKQTRLIPLILLALVAIFVLAACGGDQTPIPVYVTPTSVATDVAIQPTTIAPEIQPSETPTIAPTETPRRGPTRTVDPPTETPTRQPRQQTATPTPTVTSAIPPNVTFGAIVGPNHTLIPTETRIPPTNTPITPTVPPTAGPSPTMLPGLRSDLMGIQVHPHIDSHDYETVLTYAKELGVKWLKIQFYWGLLESATGQYTELFYMLRLYVQRAHDQGFKVMISIAKAPGWSRTPVEGVIAEAGPPSDPQILANSLFSMLDQIGFDVYGQPYVEAIEVWNEPNLQREWYGNPLTGEDYMRYFRPAYDAIRRFSPNVVVITAAPAPTGDSQWSTNDRTWLQQLYNEGLASYGSDVVVGIHPYGWANSPDARCCASTSRGWDDKPQFFFLDTIEDYREIMVANGHSNAQLWVTEFGWATFDGMNTTGGGPRPSDPPGETYFGHINQWQQAEYTIRAFEIAQQIPYLGPMILWNLNFSTIGGAVDQSDPQAGYGLLNSNWQPRPVFDYLKRVPKN